MKARSTGSILLAGLLCWTSVLHAATEYVYSIPLRDLQIEGQWPQSDISDQPLTWDQRKNLHYFLPYASVDGAQTVVDFGDRISPRDLYQVNSVLQVFNNCSLMIKSPRKAPFSGVIFIPHSDLSGMQRLEFTIRRENKPLSGEEGPKAFFAAIQKHNDLLLQLDFTGDAWFRYQSIKAAGVLNRTNVFDPNTCQPAVSDTQPDPFKAAFSLFTGEQAIRENIQLDRTLQAFMNASRTVDVSSIEGITTAQFDWASLVAGKKGETDPLAACIPADQHAIFYPTFRSMMDLMDAIRQGRQSIEPLGFSIDRLDYYEQQMCVWLDGWSRFWGPKTIRGVALTGSDPYMAEGTDSAILFDAAIGGLVYKNTRSKQKKKLKEIKGARSLDGSVDGIDYKAVVSPERNVSSYLAQIDNVVIVTNSLVQLRKIVRASQKKEPSISDADEYKFFKYRYDLKNNEQTALLVLTDAAIRRWCSPKWRIGAARRQLAASLLAHTQAAWIDAPRAFDLLKAQEFLRRWIPDIGTVSLTHAGVMSSVYGNLQFLSPVAELPIDKVSPEERQQYERFRSAYQSRWQTFFDPIAISFLHEDDKTNVDLTVRPLIGDSEYRQWMQIAGRSILKNGDGDPHPESIAHLVFAIDKDSQPVRQAGRFARQIMPAETAASAFDWLGRWIAVYVDDSPFWGDFFSQVESRGMHAALDACIENSLNAVPLAIAADVESSVRLSAFLIALRTWIEQTLPGMTVWETRAYKSKSYTKVAIRFSAEQAASQAVFYAVMPGRIIVTLDESMVRRALDRADGRPNKQEWAGNHMAVRVSKDGWKIVELLARETYGQWLQKKAWDNLPILTEWHSRSARLDESEFHRQFWNATLSSPSGTEYVWNKKLQSVESTLYGHPAVPRMPREIKTPLSAVKQMRAGITFEEDGLRAVIRLERED